MARRKTVSISTISAVCSHCGTEVLITSDLDAEQLRREAAEITCTVCGQKLGNVQRKAG